MTPIQVPLLLYTALPTRQRCVLPMPKSVVIASNDCGKGTQRHHAAQGPITAALYDSDVKLCWWKRYRRDVSKESCELRLPDSTHGSTLLSWFMD